MSAQFNIHRADKAIVARLQESLGLASFVATTLATRGIKNEEEAKEFFSPSLERDWQNPYIIPGMKDVADALEQAIRANKHIVVFGDFDLDGISATTTLVRGLRSLGAHATPFIPLRFEEGYGITKAAYKRLKTLNPDFVVTVDCGISCKAEVDEMLADGIEVAITDHHEPAEQVPVGVPVTDPKAHADCPSNILAGVGVALKLVQVLGARFGTPHLWRELIDFATLGTVADLMPMRAENRSLVAEGLALMNTNPRPCIAALMSISGANDKPLTASNLSFTLIPRLNAAGRMGIAQLALDLLMCDDYGQACALAQKLEETNDERRRIEAELAEVANARASEIYSGQRALVVSGEGWHEGVKGIVANRLVGIYGVPTILFTIEGEEARGSGRSVGQVNLFKAVESTSDLLTRFGGHEAAVGVTLPTKNLPEFTRRLCEYMDTLDEDAFHPRIDIDACVNLDELTIENVEQLEKLAPFGQQNLVPCFMARNVVLGNCRAVGANKNHFSCTLSAGHNMVSAIMFHCENIEALLQTDCVVNASFSLQIDEWRGRRSVKAMLKTLEPTRVCQALNACLDPNNLNFVDDLYQLSVDDLRVGAASGEAREQSSMQDFGQPGAQSAQLGAQSAQLGAQSAQLGGQACEQVHYQTREQTRAHWEDIARKNPAALQDAVVRALIGQGNLHPSQQQILDALDAGQSVLGVMATGRGKSLTFQVHATKRALLNHEVSVFIYPLRALIADQAFHIGEALKNFGITAEILTGESMPEERKRVLSGLGSGKVDIVLTTPEFLSYHAQELAKCGRIGFVVVDEAHHIGLASQAHRAPYAQIGKAIYTMGNPVVLALSATVDTPGAQDIDAILRLKTRVLDNASRDNLYIDDQRNLKNRDDYLAHLVARGEKMLIYVNSREQSIMLARMLRKRVPQLALLIGFYNAGLGREERKRIEELFRTDALSVLVATSAFGEGVNIPNIRHVVLYHMPFNEIEFNQMSGRAGRDGKPATIHLLYGRKDAHINRAILSDMTPDHDVMAQIYRRLRAVGRMSGKTFFSMGNTELAALSSSRTCTVSPASVACGIAVFRELGLVETRIEQTNDVRTCAIHVNTTESKVELVDSVRYREGLSERETFNAFHESALRMSAQSLQWRISHPIVPDGGQGDGGKSDGGRGSVDQANTKANANKSNAQGSGNRPNAPGNGNRPNAQGNTDKFNTNENEVR